MDTARRTSKNVSYLFVGYAVSQLLRAVYFSILAHYIGASGVGMISTASALMSLLILLVNFGLDSVVIREVARDRSDGPRYYTNAAILRLGLTLILVFVLAALSGRAPYPAETKVIIAIYALTFILDSFSDLSRSIFHAHQKMQYRMILDLGREIVNVTLSLVCIFLNWSLIVIVLVSAFASLLKLIASLGVMRWRFIVPVRQIDLRLCRQILASALPFLALTWVGVIGDRYNTIYLSWVSAAQVVGIYAAAKLMVDTLMAVPEMFNESLFPVFSQYHGSSAAGLKKTYQVSYKALLVIGFPMGAGVMLISPYLIPLYYGPGFEQAVLITNLLAIQFFAIVGYVNGPFLAATSRQTLYASLRAISVTLNVLLCFVLVPRYGLIGAAFALLIPTLIDFVVHTLLCHHFAGARLPWLTYLKTTVATLWMSSLSYLALTQGVSPLLVIPFAALLYLSAVLVLRVFDADERQFFYQAKVTQRLRQAFARHEA